MYILIPFLLLAILTNVSTAGLGYQVNKFNVNVLVNYLLDLYSYTGAPFGDYYWQTETCRNVRLSVGYRF